MYINANTDMPCVVQSAHEYFMKYPRAYAWICKAIFSDGSRFRLVRVLAGAATEECSVYATICQSENWPLVVTAYRDWQRAESEGRQTPDLGFYTCC